MATANPTGALDRATRRATVRRLADEQGMSARAIARRLKVGKDTVRRDLEATAPTPAPPAPTSGAAPAPRRPTLVKELDPRLIQDLNVLVDRRTGALPSPLDRIVRAYADRTRAEWRTSMQRRAQAKA
ncbi:hypothetical protein ACIQUU_32030 [Streptomyces sp. NPDC101116]|uniref:hypothetical protein n=1 Tax=Streptomyces sp. NPDC101116 TaxID=3366107 RepID=UPI00381E22EC